MSRLILPMILFNLLLLQDVMAVTVVKCEDEAGNKSFQLHCPPGSTLIDQHRLQTKTRTDPDITPKVYIAQKCRACDMVVQFFESRNINIEGKSIDDGLDVQNELKDIMGDLKVPTIIIGDRVLTGYRPDELSSVLRKAGFTDLEQKK